MSVSDITVGTSDQSQLYSNCTWAESAYYDAYEELHDLPKDDPEIPAAQARLDESHAHWVEAKAMYDEVVGEDAKIEALYQRPNGCIFGIFSKMLPPGPKGMKPLTADDLSAEPDLPKYRLLPLLVLGLVAVLIFTLLSLFDWSSISPLSIAVGNHSVDTDQGGAVTTIDKFMTGAMVLFVLLLALSWRGVYRWLQGMAVQEEQWFRSGAERWSISQRVRSCTVFGMCHVVNLIYPVATLLVLMIGGAVFTMVYLAEYRRAQDARRATLAAAQFHTNYIAYALCLFGIWFLISVL